MTLQTTPVGDWVAPGGILAFFLSVFGVFSAVIGTLGALTALIYYAIMICRTPEVRGWVLRHKVRKVEKMRMHIRSIQLKYGLSLDELHDQASTADKIRITEAAVKEVAKSNLTN